MVNKERLFIMVLPN